MLPPKKPAVKKGRKKKDDEATVKRSSPRNTAAPEKDEKITAQVKKEKSSKPIKSELLIPSETKEVDRSSDVILQKNSIPTIYLLDSSDDSVMMDKEKPLKKNKKLEEPVTETVRVTRTKTRAMKKNEENKRARSESEEPQTVRVSDSTFSVRMKFFNYRYLVT